MFVSNKSFFITTDRWATVINDVQHLKLSVADFHIFYRLYKFRFCHLRPTSRIKNFQGKQIILRPQLSGSIPMENERKRTTKWNEKAFNNKNNEISHHHNYAEIRF